MEITKLFSTQKNENETIRGKVAPIWYWAGFGLIIFIFACIVYGRWLLDPTQAVPVTIPDNSMTGSEIFKIRVLEFISTSVALITLWIYMIKPLIKERRVPIEGFILIGSLFGYVFDTTINYVNYVMAWNVHSINIGTWAAYFPGHTGPVHYAEALLWGPSMYMYFGLLLGLIQYKIIEATRSKIGTHGAFALSFAAAFTFDLVVESFIIRTTQAYAYPHIVSALSAWVGQQYQFPLYASFLVASYSSIYVLFKYSSIRNKESFVERGALLLPKHLKLPVRFLAGVGFAALPIIVYFGGMLFFGLFAETSVQLPTYLLPTK